MRARLAAALAAVVLGGCAANTTPVTKKAYDGKPPLGAPITADEAPDGQWSWVSVPDAVCGDGSPAGLGVNPGTGPDLVVFFDGGGACWSYTTCAAGMAFDRSYGPAEFATEQAQYLPGSLLDRAVLPASLKDATLVFVPYCTGDVHGGDNVKIYSSPFDTIEWHHVGHANVMRFLERLGATWPSPRKLVVAGSSAGGFGALANYEAFRWYWPDASGYLVDDSGPPLVGDDIAASMRDAWYDAWHLGASLDPFCVDCRDDMSAGITAIAKAHRGDRVALLSHVDDLVMSTFLEQVQLGTALRRLESTVFAPAGARVFYAPGTDHMLLPTLTAETSGGTTLADWLEADFSDAAGWADAAP
jgi:Pectinacetylesterase